MFSFFSSLLSGEGEEKGKGAVGIGLVSLRLVLVLRLLPVILLVFGTGTAAGPSLMRSPTSAHVVVASVVGNSGTAEILGAGLLPSVVAIATLTVGIVGVVVLLLNKYGGAVFLGRLVVLAAVRIVVVAGVVVVVIVVGITEVTMGVQLSPYDEYSS